MSTRVNSSARFHLPRPPHRPRWLARACLMLALLVGLTPTAAPVASAAQACGYAQTYGPYGARVGTPTPQLTLAMTTCTPDQTYIDKDVASVDVLGQIARALNLSPGHVHVDNRPRIDWGDGTGWQTDGVGLGDCAAIGFFCVFYGAPHTFASPGTYKVRVQYYTLANLAWYASPEITVNVYESAPHAPVDPASWMGAVSDQIRGVKLDQLAIPATHDSGAYLLSPQSLTAPDFPITLDSNLRTWADASDKTISACPGLIWMLCSGTLNTFSKEARDLATQYAAVKPGQNLSQLLPNVADYIAAQSNAQGRPIGQQLKDGVRYLDLRLCAPAGRLTEITLCHGLYSPAGMTQVLTEIHDFVVLHPSEIVIVGLNAYHGLDGVDAKPQQRALITQIRALFSDNPADGCNNPATCLLVPTTFTPEATVDSIWQTHGRVIFMDKIGATGLDASPNPVFWDNNTGTLLGGDWVQLDDPTRYRTTVNADLACHCDTYDTAAITSGMFYTLGAAMSPTDAWVAGTLIQRLAQHDLGKTVGAVVMTAILNAANRPDLVVDPATSSGEVLHHRATMSNALTLDGLYEQALVNPDQLRNVNILSADWYHESRLVDIAIALNMARSRSVALFPNVGFTGTPRIFVGDAPDLGKAGLNDQASSLRVSPGAVLTLFADVGYQGTCQAFTADSADLRGAAIGNDAASSLRLDSRPLCGTPWLTLYTNNNLDGPSFTTTTSMPNLSGTAVAYAQSSSLVAGPGTLVSAYSQPNYAGVCQTFAAGVTPNLAATRVGNDSIQSVKLGEACPADFVTGDVTLCASENFAPPCMTLRTDVPRFSATSLGDDNLRSLDVPPGGTIALFRDENYQGMCVPFTGSSYPELRTAGMSARASSMLVNRGCPVSDDTRGVVLYDGITFTGASATFTGDVAWLGASGFNDRVSSLAITPGMVVTLFADANFQGTCMSFTANTADLRTTRFGNDSASSLRVGTSTTCSG